MLKPEVQIALGKFAKSVVKNSKQMLKRKHSDTRNLEGSIGYDLKVHKQSFSLSFFMLEYGAYIDEGVQGAYSNKKAPNSRFRYKRNKPLHGDMFKDWAKRKGINEWAVARSVWTKGMKPSLFFTKPFENAFKNLPNEVVDAFALEIDELLEQTLNT